MILWVLIGSLAAAAAWGLVAPFFRPPARPSRGAHAVGVLSTQLADLASQTASGVVDPHEAEGLRAEIARRFLVEAEAREAEPSAAPPKRWIGALGAAAVALAAIALYAAVGRPDLAQSPGPVPSAAPTAPTLQSPAEADFASLVAQLQAKMIEHPGDPKGWRLLGWSLARLGRFGEAADAYGRAARLEPAAGGLQQAEDLSAQGEAVTEAAGGKVTSPAVAAFRGALSRDSDDPRARFYLAMARDQAGDHAGALTAWILLLRDAPGDAAWLPDVRAAVERAAANDGVDISDRLPSPPSATSGQTAGIEAMVDGLARRLRSDPHDLDGWVRLMRARMVLGQTALANSALRDGLAAFARSPPSQADLRAAARDLAVPGA